MKLISLKTFGMQGHTHIWLPLLVVVAIGSIGAYLLQMSHADTLNTMYRLYNPGLGRHYITKSAAEANYDEQHGWQLNSTYQFVNEAGSGPIPTYHDYCGTSHVFTYSYSENTALQQHYGCTYAGVAFDSSGSSTVPAGYCRRNWYEVYSTGGGHYYTPYASEAYSLSRSGWTVSNYRAFALDQPCSTNPNGSPAPAPMAPSGGGTTPQPSAGYYKPIRNGISAATYQAGGYSLSNYLVVTRVDQGVDYDGTGSVYAIGNGVVTDVSTNDCAPQGWPGCNIVVYRLTNGPASGKYVYIAEDCTPRVGIGQNVTINTVICSAYAGNYGIETGWSGGGRVPAASNWYNNLAPSCRGNGAETVYGRNFNSLMISLGVPSAYRDTENGALCPVESGSDLPTGWPSW
jgi:hypothetical protein